VTVVLDIPFQQENVIAVEFKIYFY